VGMAVAIPSTLNTLLQTLSCTAFAIASQAENILPEDPGLRVEAAQRKIWGVETASSRFLSTYTRYTIDFDTRSTHYTQQITR